MARFTARAAAAALTVALLAGCEAGSTDRVLSVDATGTVVGVVYVDRDGNLQPDPTVDGAAPGVRVSLVVRGTREAAATTTSDAAGAYAFPTVPVGNYRVVVDTTTFGDSLRVARVDTSDITVTASDTLAVVVAVSYRTASIADAKQLPVGRRISIEGITLNAWSTFGDSTIHIADATGAIRLTRIPTLNIPAGDSVRVIGTLELRSGQPVLAHIAAFRIAQGSIPAPHAVSTATAANADGGALDAALARVTGAAIVSVQTTSTNDVDLTVNDGSGPLVVRIDRDTNIQAAGLVPGALLDVTGVLVPNDAGNAWRLKPRSGPDIQVDYREVTVAEARSQPVGQLVLVRGIALNGWNSFGDATVHVADATGAIRALNVPQSAVQAGDSVRAVGRIAIQDGQPVLAAATIFPGGTTAQPPQPQPVLTATAASAAGGALDAALVRIDNATILAVTQTGGNDRLLRVDDGSGALDVLVHAATGISFADLVPQGVLTATGVLVAVPGGTWQLKPRSNQDVSVAFETATIAEARSTVPVGTLVQIDGIALNDRNAFGDGTVHLYDATGSIRTFILFSSSASIAAGDSVRLRGTVRVRDGQRVLDAVTPTPLRVGVGTPAALELSVEDAASASNGSRDAALVVVRNARITANNAAGPDRILVVVPNGGGSGELEVYLHSTTITSPTQYTVGTAIDVTGVLVPVPGETRWRLKPRGDADITVR